MSRKKNSGNIIITCQDINYHWGEGPTIKLALLDFLETIVDVYESFLEDERENALSKNAQKFLDFMRRIKADEVEKLIEAMAKDE